MSYRLKNVAALTLPQVRKLEHAWLEARNVGCPLDTRVDIKPATDLSPIDAHRWFYQDWSWLGGWCRRNVGAFFAVATRECFPNSDGRGRHEHFHWLIHTGSDELREKLREAWRNRRPGPRGVYLRKADYEYRIGPNGERGNALRYITKQRGNWQRGYGPELSLLRVTIQRGGKVLGKRYKISANLRAKPIDVAMPRPVRAARSQGN